MRVLIACEESGTVRDSFIRKGHEAVSCDLNPSTSIGPHYQGDVLDIIGDGWDMMIAHPPCTFLCRSSMRWLKDARYPNRMEDKDKAIEFVLTLFNSKIPRIALENPIGVLSTAWRKPDQIIQPYMFGERATKATCLWLKNLPVLFPTDIVIPERYMSKSGRMYDQWFVETGLISDLEERRRVRSKTFQGIADAMAEQWG